MRQFVYRKPDGTKTGAVPVREVMAAAERRVVKGDGKFQLTIDRVDIGEPKTRVEALAFLGHKLEVGSPGPVYRVMNEDGAVFACRELEPAPKLDPRRAKFVDLAKWGVAHKDQIHYSQARPIDMSFNLPWTADCSGSTIAYAKAAGLPDPAGFGYNGSGSTDSILANLPRIERRDVQLGDLALWAIGADGKHVAIFTELGPDPLMASHGSDAGPIAIRLSAEDAWHSSETLHFLRVV